MIDILLVNPEKKMEFFSKKQRDMAYNSVLILGDHYSFPLEFFYIPGLLSKKGYRAQVIDCQLENITLDALIEQIKALQPKFVCVPTESIWNARCPIPFYNHVSRVTKKIKEQIPDQKIIIWGVHGRYFPEDVARETKADFLILDRPEKKLIEFLEKRPEEINGVFYSGKTKPGIESMPLEEIGIADYSVINFPKYLTKTSPLVFASRGCPFNCSFCANDNMGAYSARPIDYVIQELKALKTYGVKEVHFLDDSFGIDKKRADKLMARVAELNLKWTCQTRFDLMNQELIASMAKAGCTMISFGLESASKEIQAEVNKPIDFDNALKVIKWCRQFGIEENLFIISFLPKESFDSLNETKDFLVNNDIQTFSIAALTPLPGSRLWCDSLSKGVLKKGDYAECLDMMGQIGNQFNRDYVLKRIHSFPTEVALKASPKFKLKMLRRSWGKPKQLFHYLKKIIELYRLKAFKK